MNTNEQARVKALERENPELRRANDVLCRRPRISPRRSSTAAAPATPVRALQLLVPGWMGLWFAVFPTAETLAAQGLGAVLVLGSYAAVRVRIMRRERATMRALARSLHRLYRWPPCEHPSRTSCCA